MAKLFKQRTLKEKLANYEIIDFEGKLAIIQKWHDLYHDGTLKKQNESHCEQAFNKDIFQEVLGYKDFTNKEHTLKIKEKVTTSGQTPDATLGYFLEDKEKIKAVCEIKDANTPLDRSQRREGNMSPIQQAFKYKTQLKECPFVIATNFYEIRLFKDTQLDYELFTLDSIVDSKNDYFEFRKFYYLLNADNFISKTGQSNTEKLLSEIRIEEEEIKKEFYKEYKELRLELLRDIYKQVENPKEKFANFIIPKAQKIIDRVMFIAFAEDRGLLPEHSLRKMLKSQEDSFAPIDLWDYLKGLFKAIDKGYPQRNIPEYNGGLFKEDKELDALNINDAVCKKIAEIGKYDFSEYGIEEETKGQLDVEILGHIFEQSISDLEELKTKVNPDEVKSVSKRKKDGIFYTPDYITDYIVKNSLGKYLEEKESEIFDKNNLKEHLQDQNYTKREIKAYQEYREVLSNVKVLDPACGSGAFLVKVFDYLFKEHERVGKILGLDKGVADFTHVYKNILQNNIYGVDLNPESVEITKLSLWLKTAQKGKKLATLEGNIKCGNSLIDDPLIAGERAFKWEKEFPQIFSVKQGVATPCSASEKKAHHITWVTHNSRTSERMLEYKVKKDEGIWLDEKAEIKITETIKNIVKEDNLKVLAYNICGDHVHMILVCEEDEITNIIRKFKSCSAREYNVSLGITKLRDQDNNVSDYNFNKGASPLVTEPINRNKTQNILWAQKFSNTYLESDEHLASATEYVKYNREKHELPVNKGLEPLVQEMVCSYEEAFAPKYEGGFDVIVGNPPYVRQELLGIKNKEFYLKKFTNTGNSIADLYVYFFELAIILLKDNSKVAFISPNKWMERKYGDKMRNYLKEFNIEQIVNFGELRIFEDASTEPAITIIKKEKSTNPIKYTSITSLEEAKNAQNYIFGEYKKENLRDDIWKFLNPYTQKILDKFKNETISLNEYTSGGIFYGVKTGLNKAFIITENEAKKIIASDNNSKEILMPMVEGDDFEKWNLINPKRYMIATEYDLDIPSKYPGIYNFLLQFKDRLIKRQDKGKNWYNLRACDYYEKLSQPKIVYYHTALRHSFFFDTESYYISANCYFISNADRYLQCILNSSLFNYVKKYLFPAFGNAEDGGRIRLDANKMVNLPIKNIQKEGKEKFESLAKNLSNISKESNEKTQEFLDFIKQKYSLEKISKKLEKFYELDFHEFMNKGLQPLVQKQRKISMEEEMELMNIFNKKSQELKEVKAEIDKQDAIIDEMVFDLYGLTKEERKVVLES